MLGAGQAGVAVDGGRQVHVARSGAGGLGSLGGTVLLGAASAGALPPAVEDASDLLHIQVDDVAGVAGRDAGGGAVDDPAGSTSAQRLTPSRTSERVTVANDTWWPLRCSSTAICRAAHLSLCRHASIWAKRPGSTCVGDRCGTLGSDVRDRAVLTAAHQTKPAGKGQRRVRVGHARSPWLGALLALHILPTGTRPVSPPPRPARPRVPRSPCAARTSR